MTTEQGRQRSVFSSNCFDLIEREWETLTEALQGRRINVLGISSFEGGSTTWILDHLMTRLASSMLAIDSFEEGMGHQGQDGTVLPLSSLEQ